MMIDEGTTIQNSDASDSERVLQQAADDRRRHQTGRWKDALGYTAIIILCVAMALPFIWMVLSSFKSRQELFQYPPTFFPEEWTISNYSAFFLYPRLNEEFADKKSMTDAEMMAVLDEKFPLAGISDPLLVRSLVDGTVQVLRDSSLWRVYGNALRIVFFASLGTVFFGGLAGYAFAKIQFPGRELIFFITLASMMIPWMTVLLPRYLMFRDLGWIGTPLPLYVPELLFATPFAIFFYRQHYRSISSELIQAAQVDGANHWQIYWRIMFPLAKSVTIAVIVFTLMTKWNDLLGPLLYLTKPEQYTPPLMLYNLMRVVGNERNPASTGLRMAGAVITVLPILFIFFFAQRYFISGLTQGAVKE